MHFIRSANVNQSLKKHTDSYQLEIKECLSNNVIPTNSQFLDHIAESCRIVSSEYGVFKRKAADQGWIISESLLNPGHARLCEIKELDCARESKNFSSSYSNEGDI